MSGSFFLQGMLPGTSPRGMLSFYSLPLSVRQIRLWICDKLVDGVGDVVGLKFVQVRSLADLPQI